MMSMSVLSAVVLGLLLLAGTSDAAPYQELEPRDGYVPVYIREGDTPLREINPKLAEAFNEIDTQNLLEVDDLELEKKPELILMSVDDGMLIANQPADQVMSEDVPAELIAILPAPAPESDIAEIPQVNPIESADRYGNADVEKPEEGEVLQVETNSQQLDEAREAIKELVNVLEVEMLKKLTLAVTEQTFVGDANKEDEAQQQEAQPEAEEKEQSQNNDEEIVAEVAEVIPEQPAAITNDQNDDNDDRKILEEDDKPEVQATDVLTVDAFKTKEIDMKSTETEKIDVPEEKNPDTVSTDE